MSNPVERIIRGATQLITSVIEEAVKEAQSSEDSNEINKSLEQIKEDRISKCDHGVTFDEIAAKKLLASTPDDPNLDPAVAFVMGSPAHSQIRKLWPRLSGPCPKGCGYNGIAYASYAHYIYGDW